MLTLVKTLKYIYLLEGMNFSYMYFILKKSACLNKKFSSKSISLIERGLVSKKHKVLDMVYDFGIG